LKTIYVMLGMYSNGFSLKVKQCTENSQEAGQQLRQVIEHAKALAAGLTSHLFVYFSTVWCGSLGSFIFFLLYLC